MPAWRAGYLTSAELLLPSDRLGARPTAWMTDLHALQEQIGLLAADFQSFMLGDYRTHKSETTLLWFRSAEKHL